MFKKKNFQGGEISRLLGQYIYVDSENRGFIGGTEAEPIWDPLIEIIELSQHSYLRLNVYIQIC